MARFVDAHLHLWDPAARHHAWLEEEPALDRRFVLEDVDAGRHELAAAVFVQADCRDDEALDEVRWVQELAEQHPLVRAIVAYAPVHLGRAAEPHLAALAGEPLVVGVRRLLQDGPAEAIADPTLCEGVRLLADWNLTFDVCVRHGQLPAVVQLVERCPDTAFVLDHLGKPRVADGGLDPWRDDLARVAVFPNVRCKLSGLATEAGAAWSSAAVRPYLEHALAVFGPRRCMVGTDWPLVALPASIEQWIDAVLDVLDPADYAAVLCETAASVYGFER